MGTLVSREEVSGKSYSRQSGKGGRDGSGSGVGGRLGSEGGRGQDFGARAKRPRKSMPIALYPGKGVDGLDSYDTPRYFENEKGGLNSFNEGDRDEGSGRHSVGILGKNSMDSRKRVVSNQNYLRAGDSGSK
jgi:hypothetical protein